MVKISIFEQFYCAKAKAQIKDTLDSGTPDT